MKVVMTERDLDELQVIKDFDFDEADRDDYDEMMKAVMYFVGYRVEKDMLPPTNFARDRRCPTCKSSIIWPHRYCQHCGQRIIDPVRLASQKVAKAKKEAKENAGDE